MTIFLLILLAVCIIFIFQQWRYRERLIKGAILTQNALVETNNKTLEAYRQKCREYAALEEGQQEIIDNYENDFLDFKNQIDGLQNGAKYDREMREEVEKKLEQANLIIEKHSDKCDTLVEDIADMLIAEAMPPSE